MTAEEIAARYLDAANSDTSPDSPVAGSSASIAAKYLTPAAQVELSYSPETGVTETDTAPPPPPTPPSTWRDKLGAVQQGLLLQGHDELTGALAAIPALWPGGETYGEAYERHRDPIRAQQSAYREAHPVESLAYEMVGGVANPLTPPAVPSPQIMGLTGGAALKQYAKDLGKSLPVAGVEGALYELGASESEDLVGQFKDAAKGAVFGATGKAIMDPAGKVLKGTINSLSKRRLEKSLGKGDDFIPANVAEPESGLGIFTKSITANLPWSPVRKQSTRAIERLMSPISKALRDEEDLLELAKGRQKSIAASEKGSLAKVYTDLNRKVDATLAKEKAAFAEEGAEKSVGASRFKIVETDEMDNLFRQDRIQSAIPPGSNISVVGLNVQDSMVKISDEWRDKGFKTVTDKKFNINADTVLTKAKGDVGGSGLDDFLPEIEAILKKHLVDKTKNGVISGKNIMNARSKLRVIANQAVDKGHSAQKKEAFARAAKSIDKQIQKSLNPDEVTQFKGELAAWGDFRNTFDSSVAARKKQGNFTENEWLDKQATSNYKKVGKGTASGQPAANVNIEKKAMLDAQVEALRDTAASNKATGVQASVDKAAEQKRTLADMQAQGKSDLSGMTTPKIPVSQKTLDLEAQAKKLTDSMPPTPNVFAMRGAQSILGNALGLATGGLPGLGIAAASGQALGSQSVQRIFAGQTGGQEYIANFLRKYSSPTEPLNPEKLKEFVTRLGSSARRTGQQLNEEE